MRQWLITGMKEKAPYREPFLGVNREVPSFFQLVNGEKTTMKKIERESPYMITAVEQMIKLGKVSGQYDFEGDIHLKKIEPETPPQEIEVFSPTMPSMLLSEPTTIYYAAKEIIG